MNSEIINALKLCRECLKNHFTELDLACIKDIKEAYDSATEALLTIEWEAARTEMSEAEEYDLEQCTTANLLEMYGYD